MDEKKICPGEQRTAPQTIGQEGIRNTLVVRSPGPRIYVYPFQVTAESVILAERGVPPRDNFCPITENEAHSLDPGGLRPDGAPAKPTDVEPAPDERPGAATPGPADWWDL